MPKLIIHIGGEKTGSSSLQQSMRKSSEKNKNSNFYNSKYFRNNRDVANLFMRTPGNDDIKNYNRSHALSDIRSFVTNAKFCDISLLSSEHLSSRLLSVDEVSNFLSWFVRDEIDIEVLFVSREQQSKNISLYSTYLRKGGTKELQDFLFQINHDPFFRTDDQIHALWETACKKFGINVQVLIFESKRSIVDVLNEKYPALKLENVPRSNKALSNFQIRTVLHLNRLFSRVFRRRNLVTKLIIKSILGS